MSKLVYVAHPIDQIERAVTNKDRIKLAVRVQTVVNLVKEQLNQAGIGVYHPQQAFALIGAPISGGVAEINRAALAECDSVVAVLPAGVASVGVLIELTRAIDSGKPTVIITDMMETSWSLRDLTDRTNVRTVEFGMDIQPGIDLHGWEDAVGWLVRTEWHWTEMQIGGPDPIEFTIERTAGYGHEIGQEPYRPYSDDAGFDLYVTGNHRIPPGHFRDLPTGVSVALPPGWWGMITGRSSTLRKRGLLVSQGIIDTGYRGELYTGVWNLGQDTAQVNHGDRVAQLIPVPAYGGVLKQVMKLPEHPRGESGFGSSGP